jgi:hypothetical protein
VTHLRPVPLPDSGAVRVHPAPEVLPQLRHEGPGRNRFDDPHGIFLMRYTAANLRDELTESPTAARLAVVPAPSCSATLSRRNSSAVRLPQPVRPASERGRQHA